MRTTRAMNVGSLAALLGIGLLFGLVPASQGAARLAQVYPTSPSPARSSAVGIGGTGIGNYSFQPRTLTVKRGATVSWSWHSNAPHNVTFRKLGKHSKTGANKTYRLKFTQRGTFRYLCTVHQFTAKIVVK